MRKNSRFPAVYNSKGTMNKTKTTSSDNNRCLCDTTLTFSKGAISNSKGHILNTCGWCLGCRIQVALPLHLGQAVSLQKPWSYWFIVQIQYMSCKCPNHVRNLTSNLPTISVNHFYLMLTKKGAQVRILTKNGEKMTKSASFSRAQQVFSCTDNYVMCCLQLLTKL